MAMYSMQLREIIESYSNYNIFLSLDERIEIGREKLFSFDYPFFNETYKSAFEKNIIREFYMREIGFETEGLFKMRLEHWLNVNMPYYNKLFESELIKYDPLSNSHVNVTHTKKNDKEQNDKRNMEQTSNTHGTGSNESLQKGKANASGNSKTSGESTQDNFNRNVESDTPQDRLQISTGDGGTGVIEYASKIDEEKESQKGKTNGNSSSESKQNDEIDFSGSDETNVDSKGEQDESFDSKANELEKFVQERTGKIGVQSYGKLIQDYRNALLRVELQIHEELQKLFMLVY